MFDTLFSWLFPLNLLSKFPTNYGLLTAELQSSLAICCAETFCDCQRQIPKHKESSPLAVMAPLGHSHQNLKWENKGWNIWLPSRSSFGAQVDRSFFQLKKTESLFVWLHFLQMLIFLKVNEPLIG